jgi:hypothetical protein
LRSVKSIVRFVKKTPLVDGAGLKNTLEKRAAPFVDAKLGGYVKDKKAFVVSGADRWGLSTGFADAGYETVFGDLMFGLGIPIALRSTGALRILAPLVVPIAGLLPFEWVYPTGEKQDVRQPKYENYYQWATVIAGDMHYIRRHIPERLPGKVIVTNTTVPSDVELLKQIGIKYLVTVTPVMEGRSFGANMMEAALVAASGKGRVLSHAELDELIDELKMEPQLQELN